MMRVFFIGGGKRVSLAKRFIKKGYIVFSYEYDQCAPIQSVATIIKGRIWSKETEVIEDIIKCCNLLQIDLVIPLQNEASTICSKINQSDIPKTKIVTSSLETNAICFDKKKFESYCIETEREVYPFIDDKTNIVICKPRFGFGSRNIIVCSKEESLKYQNENYVIQKYVHPGQEVSVDCYFPRDKEKSFTLKEWLCCRWRTVVQGGEVSQSRVFNRKDARENKLFYKIKKITELLGCSLDINGPACFQYIVDKNDDFYIMEINARFGGGTILSIEARIDFVKLIEEEYFEKKSVDEMSSFTIKDNLIMTRYFEEVFI